MTKEELIKDLEQAVSNQDENVLQDLAKQGLSNFPDETFGYEYTLKVLLNRVPKDYDSIEACYIRLIQLNETDNSYAEAYAALLEEKGDFEKAASVYLNIYEQNPGNLKALNGLGNYFLNANNNLEAALPYLENAAAHEDARSEAFISLAAAYHKAERKEEALKLLDLSLSEGFSQEAAVLKIDILSALEKHEETIELYNTLVGYHPEVLAYHYNFAKMLDALDRFGTAVYQYEAAIKIAEEEDMATAAIYLEYGMSLLRIGSYEKSVEAIKTSLEVSENPIAKVELLKALNGAKQYDEARTLAKSLLNNPDLGEIFKKKVRYEIGMLHIALEEWSLGTAIFDKLVKSPGAKAIGNFGLGVIADKNEGNTLKAIELLKSSLSMGHKEAGYYIEDELVQKLAEIKSKILAENKETSDLSTISSFVNQILVFKGVLKDGKLDTDTNLQGVFEHTILYLNTRGGFILYNDGFQNQFVHKATNKGDVLELELIYIDGQAAKQLQLSEKDDSLIYQDRAERKLVFTVLEEMTAEIRTLFYKYINFSDLDFLGEPSIQKLNAAL